jgi:hypothetical protein
MLSDRLRPHGLKMRQELGLDCRSDAASPVAGASEKTHQARVAARRARRNIRQTRADTLHVRAASAEMHPRRIFGLGFHDDPVTLRCPAKTGN